MTVLTMDFGYSGEYMLSKLFAMNQYWDEKPFFRMTAPRETSALLYAAGCKLEYQFAGGKFTAKQGDIVYLPQGSMYQTRFIGTKKGQISTVLINFVTLLPNAEPFVFGKTPMVVGGNVCGISEYFSEMVHLFKAPVSSPSLNKSVLYRILCAIGYEERTVRLLMTEFAPIANGILYMENDIHQKKNISQIAELCHVSPSYFRKLFKKYAGKSPIEYQICVKLSHAQQLLRTNTMSIAEIADTLGFFDAAYFCKVFKKHIGLSPKEYAKSFVKPNIS